MFFKILLSASVLFSTAILGFALHDVCKLPAETGPCEVLVDRWFHNISVGKCEIFKFGGCDGNRNNFKTLQNCQAVCERKFSDRFLLTQESKKACRLPKDEGTCYGAFPRYFYNKDTKSCEKFIYGGCAGNSNNFLTLIGCERRCIQNVIEVEDRTETVQRPLPLNDNEEVYYKSLKPIKTTNVCSMVAETGPCTKRIRRYFYNKFTKKCTPFVYGGCEGNENNFMTLHECKRVCIRSLETYSLVGGVSLATCRKVPESGPCEQFVTKFYFNAITQQCETFQYGGCGGNGNKFDTRDDCEQACTAMNDKLNEMLSHGACKDKSSFEMGLATDCYKLSISYSYNETSNECDRFYYSGCGGNKNRFRNKQLCVDTCVKK